MSIEEDKNKNLQAKGDRVCIWFVCWTVPSRWYPSGTVRIEDTELGWQPVQGGKVRARSFEELGPVLQDAQGELLQ